MLFTARGRGGLLIMPRPLSGCQIKPRSRAFCCCIVCFCTNNGSFIILKLVEFSFCLTHPVLSFFSNSRGLERPGLITKTVEYLSNVVCMSPSDFHPTCWYQSLPAYDFFQKNSSLPFYQSLLLYQRPKSNVNGTK